MHLEELQRQIERVYGHKDASRGIDGTFLWFLAEVGELAAAIREGSAREIEAEAGDVLAWLATVANVAGVSLEKAAQKYASSCRTCGAAPCTCTGKP